MTITIQGEPKGAMQDVEASAQAMHEKIIAHYGVSVGRPPVPCEAFFIFLALGAYVTGAYEAPAEMCRALGQYLRQVCKADAGAIEHWLEEIHEAASEEPRVIDLTDQVPQ